VHVKSADIKKLDFDVNASNYAGAGHLEFYYNNLNVEFLKKDSTKGLVKQGFISKIANYLIINNDNPDKKGKFVQGPINFKRESDVSFFSFLYKALLNGIKPSVGYGAKTEHTVTKAIDKIGGLIDKYTKFKEDHKQKREEKKQQKEQKKLQEEKSKKAIKDT